MPADDGNIEIVYGDVRNLDDVRRLVAGTEALVHLAAGMKGSRAFVIEICVEGTRNVVQAVKEAGLRRNLYVSSMSVLIIAV